MNTQQSQTQSPAHILLAEDDEELRTLLHRQLKKDGHRVTELADGWALDRRLARTDEPRFDLVLSDVRMPGPSVFSTLERAWQLNADAPPVVLMSAFPDEAVQRRAREIGAAMFDKPFDPDDLRTCIGHMLERERQWRPKRQSAKLRVLVAEDDTELRRLVVGEMSNLGYDVEVAKDGFALLGRLADAELDLDPFALIVSDVRMPGVTGLSVLRGLRASDSPRFRTTPVLLMTAFGDDATRAEARRLGALLLDKPFQLEELRMWSRLLTGKSPKPPPRGDVAR
ncbi:MAG: response regulator [Polyangia bacterium]